MSASDRPVSTDALEASESLGIGLVQTAGAVRFPLSRGSRLRDTKFPQARGVTRAAHPPYALAMGPASVEWEWRVGHNAHATWGAVQYANVRFETFMYE